MRRKVIQVALAVWQKLRQMAFDDGVPIGALVARLAEAEWQRRHEEAQL